MALGIGGARREKAEGQVPTNIRALTSEIETLEKGMAELESVLASVLMPEVAIPKSDDVQTTRPLIVEVAEQVNGQMQRIVEVNGRIQSIISRLQL